MKIAAIFRDLFRIENCYFMTESERKEPPKAAVLDILNLTSALSTPY